MSSQEDLSLTLEAFYQNLWSQDVGEELNNAQAEDVPSASETGTEPTTIDWNCVEIVPSATATKDWLSHIAAEANPLMTRDDATMPASNEQTTSTSSAEVNQAVASCSSQVVVKLQKLQIRGEEEETIDQVKHHSENLKSPCPTIEEVFLKDENETKDDIVPIHQEALQYSPNRDAVEISNLPVKIFSVEKEENPVETAFANASSNSEAEAAGATENSTLAKRKRITKRKRMEVDEPDDLDKNSWEYQTNKRITRSTAKKRNERA